LQLLSLGPQADGERDFRDDIMDEWQLRNVWHNRQPRHRIVPLGETLTHLMQARLAKRVRQIGVLAAIWDECVPEYIREHTALVNFARGTLTVAVDSAAHRYQLQVLLRNGLQEAIRERFPGSVNRIRLVPGQFDCLDLSRKNRPMA
jgi:predicted nucleic acid-binding Zn ribbon protein